LAGSYIKNSKTVSRVLFYLSITSVIYLCYLPPGSGEQPSNPGICGIATRKVYPNNMSPYCCVSSYLTFSPFSARSGWLFSVALSVVPASLQKHLPFQKCGALCCPDFPPRINSERQNILLQISMNLILSVNAAKIRKNN